MGGCAPGGIALAGERGWGDRCFRRGCLGGTPESGQAAGLAGADSGPQGRPEGFFSGRSEIAIDERGELRLGDRTDLGGLDLALAE
jgi:hypothetical protein